MDWSILFNEWYMFPQVLTSLASPSTFLGIVLGCIIGFVFGVVPGLTALMAMTLILSLALLLPPDICFGAMLGIYTAAIASGGFTSIMINIPGTPAAAVTVLDGHPMARKGMAREAVGAVIVSSIFGELLSISIFLITLPFFIYVVLSFGDWEVFLFCCMGLVAAGALAGKDPLKGWITALMGIILGLIGTDPVFGFPRYTFGVSELAKGIDLVAALTGLFGLSEVLMVLKERKPYQLIGKVSFPKLDFRIPIKYPKTFLTSVLVGLWIGFIPAVGEGVSPWLAYDFSRRLSKNKDKFGTGWVEGVIAPEIANNATLGGALIPTLLLGVPGSATTAIILAAMYLYNIPIGPLLPRLRPGTITTIIVLTLISCAIGLLILYLLAPMTMRILSLPREVILPLLIPFFVLAVWGSAYTVFDIWTLFLFGILGFALRLADFPIPPLVLGFVLSRPLEMTLRRSIVQYSTNLPALFLRPVGLIIIAILLLMIIGVRRFTKRGQ
jgi:putative tricarboxylic transport membrane protein